MGIKLETGGHTNNVYNSDLWILSPGISDKIEIIRNAKNKGIKIVSEIEFASWFTDKPIIAVTGTNGKTSVASMLYEVMTNLKYKCGLISTVAIKYCDVFHEATHTTPDAISIQKYLSERWVKGITHCFMEVSSHGIAQHRVSGLYFSGGVFTNLTHDHLDYHGSFKNYRDIKKVFFDLLPPKSFALSNTDDKNGMYMMQNTKAKKIHYALKRAADYQAKILEQQFSGMLLKINNQELWTSLVGNFNTYNLLAVFATTEQLGVDPLEVLKQLSKLKSQVGRFQIFQTKEEITIIIDYAHTPDALTTCTVSYTHLRAHETKANLVFRRLL